MALPLNSAITLILTSLACASPVTAISRKMMNFNLIVLSANPDQEVKTDQRINTGKYVIDHDAETTF